MLAYNKITEKKHIIFNDEPYEVISSHVFRKQKRKPVNATKLRNLLTGRVIEHSFHVPDKAPEAEIENKEIKYLYNNREEFWFCEKNNPRERFKLPEELIGEQVKFLKENSEVTALVFNEKIIGLKIPIKVELKVIEAQPAVKGNTAQGATKEVVLETGAVIQVPLFIKEGDVLRINTEKGEYVERA